VGSDCVGVFGELLFGCVVWGAGKVDVGIGVDAHVDDAEGGLDRLLCCSDVESL
jgi:hypothetical protein